MKLDVLGSRFAWVALAYLLTACTDNQQAVTSVSEGEQIVNSNCKACHASGLNGAPIIGNRKMWAKRLPQGVPTLVEHAVNGYGLMPAKGGNTALTDEQIAQAVEFMVYSVR